jgi:O-antigen ligase
MTLRHTLVPAYLVLCLLLGGASVGGYMGNLILQLAALQVIVLALVRPQFVQPVPVRTLMLLLAALVGVMLVQLVPLPPSVWSSLSGRERMVEGYALLEQNLPWLPLSLSYFDSVAALLWLLPAFAVLLGILRLGAYRASVLAWCLLGFTAVSVLIAAVQVTSGSDSPFYFYDVTNRGSGVGFFANSNHQATLLICTMPFLAALFAARGSSQSLRGASGLATVLGGLALVLGVGVAINGSLAGLGLGVGVAVGSVILLRSSKRPVPTWTLPAALVATVGCTLLILFSPLGGGSLMKELETSSGSRETMIATTAEAAAYYFPFGSGAGTFVDVYRGFEDPNLVGGAWINHAHCDMIEILLETGLMGGILMLLFLSWWARRAYVVWIKDERPDHFARAAVIASAAIIAHSFVDYPLRTAAISALFAVCLALMAQPRPSVKARVARGSEDDGPRHLSA